MHVCRLPEVQGQRQQDDNRKRYEDFIHLRRGYGAKIRNSSRSGAATFHPSGKLKFSVYLFLPAVLKDNVTSPAGSTIEGVAERENRGLRGIIISVLYKAFEKTLLFAKKK